MQNIKRLVADIADRTTDDRTVVEALEEFVNHIANTGTVDAVVDLARLQRDALLLRDALSRYNETREAASW